MGRQFPYNENDYFQFMCGYADRASQSEARFMYCVVGPRESDLASSNIEGAGSYRGPIPHCVDRSSDGSCTDMFGVL